MGLKTLRCNQCNRNFNLKKAVSYVTIDNCDSASCHLVKPHIQLLLCKSQKYWNIEKISVHSAEDQIILLVEDPIVIYTDKQGRDT